MSVQVVYLPMKHDVGKTYSTLRLDFINIRPRNLFLKRLRTGFPGHIYSLIEEGYVDVTFVTLLSASLIDDLKVHIYSLGLTLFDRPVIRVGDVEGTPSTGTGHKREVLKMDERRPKSYEEVL